MWREQFLGWRDKEQRLAQSQAREVVVANFPEMARYGAVQARAIQSVAALRSAAPAAAWMAAMWLMLWASGLPTIAPGVASAATAIALACVIMFSSRLMVLAVEVMRIPFADFDWVTYLDNHRRAGGIEDVV